MQACFSPRPNLMDSCGRRLTNDSFKRIPNWVIVVTIWNDCMEGREWTLTDRTRCASTFSQIISLKPYSPWMRVPPSNKQMRVPPSQFHRGWCRHPVNKPFSPYFRGKLSDVVFSYSKAQKKCFFPLEVFLSTPEVVFFFQLSVLIV